MYTKVVIAISTDFKTMGGLDSSGCKEWVELEEFCLEELLGEGIPVSTVWL